MFASQQAYNLIKQFEGLCLTSYNCPAGVHTIGWGHTSGVQLGTTITEDQAEVYLQSDVVAVEAAVNAVLAVPTNQNQYDALVSFTFNVGATRFKASTLLYKLNHGDAPGAGQEFLKWVYANVGGTMTVLPGLKTRREAESALFLTPVTN